MTLDELIAEICYGCRHAEWDWVEDEDGFGCTLGEVVGCRKECAPFYNEDAEAADCDEWERRKDVYDD